MLLNMIEQGPQTPSPETAMLPPVVFLHGLFGRARNFGFLQRQIAKTRRTVALDLRSHGASPHGPLDYDALAADVIETLTQARALPAILVGHSMGGKTAMAVALAHPDQVTALLVADIAPTHRPPQQNALVEAMQGIAFPDHLDLQQARILLTPAIPDAPVRDLILQNLRLGDQPGWAIGLPEIAASLSRIYSWPYANAATHPQYDGPTLFIRGGESDYVRDQDLAVIASYFPHYQLETIQGVGHWVHAAAPREFSALLEKFVETAPTGAMQT